MPDSDDPASVSLMLLEEERVSRSHVKVYGRSKFMTMPLTYSVPQTSPAPLGPAVVEKTPGEPDGVPEATQAPAQSSRHRREAKSRDALTGSGHH